MESEVTSNVKVVVKSKLNGCKFNIKSAKIYIYLEIKTQCFK